MAAEPGSRGPSPSDDDFDDRLKAAQKRRETEKSKWKQVETRGPSGLGVGMRIASEIVAAILVSVAIGLMLDRFLGTKPWMLILFIVLGSGAALTNVVRTGQELDRKQREAKARATEQAHKKSAAESEGQDERRD